MTEIGQETDPLKIAEKELNEKKVWDLMLFLIDSNHHKKIFT